MASMVSVSESIQASLIIQHQLHQQQSGQQHALRHQHQEQNGVRLLVQLLVVACLFGIEMCVSFGQIYQILFLQYLGVPVSLVSVNGIVCGGTSMILLPLLGCLADRGSNPKLRKLCSLLMGLAMFLCGLALLIACGFVKLMSLENILDSDAILDMANTTTMLWTPLSSGQAGDNATLHLTTTMKTLTLNSTMVPNSEAEGYSSLPVIVFMSITGFAFVDIGFDISVSLSRAFILESIPTFQHTRLLVMATIMQSIGGTTFSIIGCLDFPGLLGPIFNVDGFAATLIFFCFLIFCIVLIGYVLTISTGFYLFKKSCNRDKIPTSDEKPSVLSTPSMNTENRRAARRKLLTRNASHLQQLQEDKPYVPKMVFIEARDTAKKPLLEKDALNVHNYASISISTSSVVHSLDNADIIKTSDHQKANCALPNDSAAVLPEANTQNAKEDSEAEDVDAPNSEHHHGLSAVMAAIKQSYSMSLSVMQPALGDFHSRKLAQLQNQTKKTVEDRNEKKKKNVNKRLIILCMSCFFTMGCSLSFIMYVSNALTIGIFHGDPSALPGTEGHEMYQRGLRNGALGNLVLYSSYMLVSLNNKKIIDKIGEKAQYVLCHVFLIVSLLTLLLTKNLEVYFVFMVFCGAFRTCVFTLPFVLANKFTQEQDDGDTDQPVKNAGKVMSLIGFLLPCHYICVSIFMGPLMEATGNVWIPLIYSLCCGSASLLIFSSLFFVKR